MEKMTSIPGPVVLQDATKEQLEQGIALNHQTLFCLEAILAGGKINVAEGVTWTYAGRKNNSMIIFPHLTNENADTTLDKIMTSYSGNVPKGIGCWSLYPSQPADLDLRLLARGFQTGWQPCWMVLDLKNIQTDHAAPEELRIIADNTTSLNSIKDLPYAEDSERTILPAAMEEVHPGTMQRFVAMYRGKIVAQTSVLLTEGEYGVAGIYNVGVIPKLRNKGIGKAVVIAACLYAKEKGFRYATLNGTGRRMYEQVGFQWLSSGLTWWMDDKKLAHLPSKEEIQLAEAIGRADIKMLEQLSHHYNNDELSAALTNGMTPMQLAVHFQQTSSAKWLIAKGVPINVLEAWDLGWKGEARQILTAHPEYVDQVYGEFALTILHEAAKRNDIVMTEMALSFNPNLTIKDKIHKGTPLDWANYFRRGEIARLIGQFSSKGSKG